MGNKIIKKVHIASSRPVGEAVKLWAKDNLPDGWKLTDKMDECDVFISTLYAKLIPEDFIMGRRCYNFHPGILPQYRGSGSFSWSLIKNNTHSGVTLHEIDGDIDHGDIIKIVMWPITPEDTAGTLYNKGMIIIEKMFRDWFKALLENEYKATEQDESLAKLYFKKDLQTAKDLTRYVRAFTFKGKESAYYINKKGQKIWLEM